MDVARNTITEASKLSHNNKMFMLRYIFLLLITPFFFIVLLHAIIVGPQMQKVEDGYETSSLDQKDVMNLVVLEIPFFLAFSVVWLFGTATTIVVAASAHANRGGNKSLADLKELMFACIKSKSKKIVYLWLYASLAIIIFGILFLAFFTLTEAIFGSNSTAAVAFSWASVSVAAVLYPYLASIYALGHVISVLEENCQGIRALEEARRLVNGRKMQSYLIMLFLTLLSIPIYILFYVTAMDDDDEFSFITGLPFMFVATAVFCLANFFIFVVFTSFYFEMKQSCGHILEMVDGIGYSPCTAFADTTST
ncbi:hypothetical protein ACH5RR_007829 [Cinchona calisaya]|uniref:Uncharacterized protein n=1 Tax=Cinchona calisaya TaxID=153742 RepID=A0ABD3A9Z1_9GENT